MAQNVKKKSARSVETEKLLQIQQEVEGNEIQPDAPKFTPEQRHTLGQAYRLILGWQQEHTKQPVLTVTDDKHIARPTSNRALSVEGEA